MSDREAQLHGRMEDLTDERYYMEMGEMPKATITPEGTFHHDEWIKAEIDDIVDTLDKQSGISP